METMKECPLCGGTMQLHETKTTTQLPGSAKPTVQTGSEWVCPECDYFEETGEDDEKLTD